MLLMLVDHLEIKLAGCVALWLLCLHLNITFVEEARAAFEVSYCEVVRVGLDAHFFQDFCHCVVVVAILTLQLTFFVVFIFTFVHVTLFPFILSLFFRRLRQWTVFLVRSLRMTAFTTLRKYFLVESLLSEVVGPVLPLFLAVGSLDRLVFKSVC